MISKESGTRQAFALFFSSPPQCLAVIYLLLYKCICCFFSYVERNKCYVMLCTQYLGSLSSLLKLKHIFLFPVH